VNHNQIQTGPLMKTHEEELQQIKGLLRDNPKGLKITRIARELAMNRNAAAKFLRSSWWHGRRSGRTRHVENFYSFTTDQHPNDAGSVRRFILILIKIWKSLRKWELSRVHWIETGKIFWQTPGYNQSSLIGTRPLFDRIRESHFGAESGQSEIIDKKEFFFGVRLTPTVFMTAQGV